MHKEIRNAYEILIPQLEFSRPLGRPRLSWEEDMKMGVKEIGSGDVDTINLAESYEHSFTKGR
jgi:hypothetical protein